MLILHLGVVEFPYSGDEAGQTTGDVAEILEAKYGVMQNFFDTIGGDAIAKALERSVAHAVENIQLGSNSVFSLTAEGEEEIQNAFDEFLTQQDMDGRVAGVPTQAAQMGVSHRFKHPYAQRAPRPSFVDTGLYLYSFTAWVDGESSS